MTKEMFIYLFISLIIIISCIISIRRQQEWSNNTKYITLVPKDENMYENSNVVCAEHTETGEEYEINISNKSLDYVKPIGDKQTHHYVFKKIDSFDVVKRLRPNGIYRHFKGMYYKYIKIVYDVSAGQYLVLYMALYGDNQYWVRPIEDFLSLVDMDKYPESKQKYRFELIRKNEIYEREVSYALIRATNYFMKMSNHSDFDVNDFTANMRNCQRIVAMKAIRRNDKTYIETEIKGEYDNE